jgi:hypothetical protein
VLARGSGPHLRFWPLYRALRIKADEKHMKERLDDCLND